MPLTSDQHRAIAVETFNRTWDLLEAEPGPERDQELLSTVLASHYHWRIAGEPRNFAISDWQVSRAFSAVGDAAQATAWGLACLDLIESHDLGAFLLGSAHEALARAALTGGDTRERDRYLALADQALAAITDDEEREVLEADLQDLRGA